ncbi:MAG TPA: hypothetical protein VFV51_00315 [Vicinamibacterales bacterium]|nr:hypothetical protein [Vicinamibacterales bacterium]
MAALAHALRVVPTLVQGRVPVLMAGALEAGRPRAALTVAW